MAFSNPNLFAENASTFEGGSTAWVPNGSNTSLSVVTSEYLTGSRSMRITATAAGSVEAISPRFTVTAGKTYAVRMPIRLSSTTAGKVYTARINWFDAASGGNILAQTDFIINLGTSSGWQNGNYAVPSGVAPPGAKSATAKITVTGLAAGEFVNTDDVYAAEIPRRAGDLLSFNTGSFENDVSGWTATNATISRGQATLYAGAGYYSMLATSTTTGEMDIRTSSMYDVTEGQTYVSYAAVLGTSTPLPLYFELRWCNAAGEMVGSDARTYSVTGAISRISVTGTAPAGATKVQIAFWPQSTAVGQQVAFDDVTLCPAPNAAGNLLTYEEYSSESSLPPWLPDGMTLDREYMVSSITEGFFCIQATPAEKRLYSPQLERLIPVTPGVTYRVGAAVWRHTTDTTQDTGFAMRTRVDWYDAAGALFELDTPDQLYYTSGTAAFLGVTNSTTRTCPEGAAFARVGVEIDHSTSLVDRYLIDTLTLVEATPEYTLGASNETGSLSLVVNYLPPAAADQVTIQRIDENGKASPMRGYGVEYTNAPYTPGTILVEDYEAPLATRVWYKVTWHQDGVEVARLFTRTVDTPTLDDGDFVWFKSPGNPALNTRVMMEAPVKWSRAARSVTYNIVGRKNPVNVTSVRSGRTGSLSVLIWDPSANVLFDSLLDSGSPSLIQAMPGYGIDGNLYLSIGSVDVEPLSPNARENGWRWTLNVTEVDRPAGGLQGSAGTTWATIADTYATWDDLFSAFGTWTEVLTKG